MPVRLLAIEVRRGTIILAAKQPCQQSAQHPAGVGDRNGITEHAEVEEGKEHFSRKRFDEAFERDQAEGTEPHSEKDFVPLLTHQVKR